MGVGDSTQGGMYERDRSWGQGERVVGWGFLLYSLFTLSSREDKLYVGISSYLRYFWMHSLFFITSWDISTNFCWLSRTYLRIYWQRTNTFTSLNTLSGTDSISFSTSTYSMFRLPRFISNSSKHSRTKSNKG